MSTALPEREARSHVTRGIAVGMKSPREAPGSKKTAPTTNGTTRAKRPRSHLPSVQATAFWSRCAPASTNAGATRDLRARSIDPWAVEAWNLARAIPNGQLPRWARSRDGTWAQTGHRLLIPMFDADGAMRGFRARRLVGGNPKALVPGGYEAGGLVFACPLMQQVLSGGIPAWWNDSQLVVEIVEGGPDFLSVASRRSESRELAPATLGVVAGSWRPEMAARIPSGVRVVLAAHGDSAGRKYTRSIGATLRDRCEVLVSTIGTAR